MGHNSLRHRLQLRGSGSGGLLLGCGGRVGRPLLLCYRVFTRNIVVLPLLAAGRVLLAATAAATGVVADIVLLLPCARRAPRRLLQQAA